MIGALGVAVYGVWWYGLFHLLGPRLPAPWVGFRTALLHGAGALWLLFALALLRPFGLLQMQWLPRREGWRVLAWGALGVAAAYVAQHLWRCANGVAPEPYMDLVLMGTPLELGVRMAALFVLVPLSEELAHRHVLMGSLGWERGGWRRWLALLAVSLWFSLIHGQYGNPSTFVLLFCVACILAWARMASRSVLVPMLLHALAVGMALALHVAARP